MNHYVYIVRRGEQFYVGMRSCLCAIEDDGYMGSGTGLPKDMRGWSKTVLAVVGSRGEAVELERALVTREVVLDPHCVNRVLGGQMGRTGPLGPRSKPRAKETKPRANKGKPRGPMSEEHRALLRGPRGPQKNPRSKIDSSILENQDFQSGKRKNETARRADYHDGIRAEG